MKRRKWNAVKFITDRYRGAWATSGAEEIAEAMKAKPAPEPARTLADMSVEEKRGLEKLYGVRICERTWRK